MTEDGFRAAVAAGVIGSNAAYASLLRSIVEVARAIFGAQRSSIFLLDEEADELVFEAIAGDEEQGPHRHAHPVEHRHRRLDPRDASAARDRGPDAGPAARARGRRSRRATCRKGSCRCRCSSRSARSACSRCSTGRSGRASRSQEMELLGLFANQAAIALDLLQRSRRATGGAREGERGRRGRRSARCRARRARGGRPREGAAAARGARGRSAQMKRAPWRRPSQNSGRGSKGGRGACSCDLRRRGCRRPRRLPSVHAPSF